MSGDTNVGGGGVGDGVGELDNEGDVVGERVGVVDAAPKLVVVPCADSSSPAAIRASTRRRGCAIYLLDGLVGGERGGSVHSGFLNMRRSRAIHGEKGGLGTEAIEEPVPG